MDTILIVDDERLFAMSVAEVLTEAGFSVHCEHVGQSAISAAQGMDVTGAIVDLGLPDCNGEDVARALRERHPTIPILVCTGFDKQALAPLAEELQLQIVEKPIEDAVLVRIFVEHTARLPTAHVRAPGTLE